MLVGHVASCFPICIHKDIFALKPGDTVEFQTYLWNSRAVVLIYIFITVTY